MIRKIVRLAAVISTGCLLASAMVVGPARADTCGGKKPLPTLNVRITSRHRRYQVGEKARIRILVTRLDGEVEFPAEGIAVTASLMQGDVTAYGVDETDAEGRAVATVSLGFFAPGYIDVGASAWNPIATELPCYGQLGESGDAIELDLIRLVRN